MHGTKGLKNIFFGFLSQIITIALGVIIPRLVIVNLGSESNGLLSSIGNILTYLSLLEAGVGTASIQALYKPIAQNDRNSINKVMSATHHFYRRTGFIYLGCVLLLSIGYSLLIDSTLPRVEIFAIALMAGLSGVIGFFFQGKIRIYLSAEGKNYVISNITTITSVATSVGKAVALVCGADVVVVQLIHFVISVLQMIIYVVYFKRNYKWIDYHVEPDYSSISQKNAVLVHQVSGFVFSNTDVLLLTVFVSLKAVSVYNMYAMVYGMVKAIAVMASDSFLYELGQSYHDRQRFIRLFDSYEMINMSITFSLFCIAKVLMIPFMRLYTAGVSDINYVDDWIAWEFVIYYLLHNARQPSGRIIEIAQKFDETKWQSIIEAIINLVVSISLTRVLGIYGVLLGTIAALLYRSNDMIVFGARRILSRSPWITYRRWLRNCAIFALVILATNHINLDLSNYGYLFLYGIVLCVTVIPLFFGINFLCEREVGRYTVNVVRNLIGNKLHRKKD